jgi:hypothetical protein
MNQPSLDHGGMISRRAEKGFDVRQIGSLSAKKCRQGVLLTESPKRGGLFQDARHNSMPETSVDTDQFDNQ